MARNAITQARNVALPRTAPTYPRTPVGGVFIPGAKSIEGATGDTPITANGWIENRKYKHLLTIYAGASSAEFDTAVTRTGTKTLKLSNTNDTGSCDIQYGSPDTKITFKPNTQYVFKCWAKTNNVPANAVWIRVSDGTVRQTNSLTGTVDWTLLTVTWTTGATPAFQYFSFRLLPGATSDVWFDVNSLTLTEVLPRNPVV